jgi:hypothetical protein
MKKLMILLALFLGLSLQAQDTLYYYNGQPLVDNDSFLVAAASGGGGGTSYAQDSLFTYNDQVIIYNDSLVAKVEESAAASYDTDYQAVYDEMTNKPPSTIAAYQDTLVRMMKDSSVWTEGDAMWVYAQYSNSDGEALLNWYDPDGTSATAVSAPTFTSNQGFTGDGSADYIDLNWNPSTDGSNFVQDDAAFAVYIRNNVNGAYSATGGSDGSNSNFINPRASDNYYGAINASGYTGLTTSATSVGCWITTRTSSNNMPVYLNGVEFESYSHSSTGLPNVDHYALAYNNNGSAGEISPYQISIVWYGAGLSATQARALNNCFEYFMDNLGYGVQ